MRFLLVVVLLTAGCASTERAAYITAGSLTTGVELARQAYVQHENTCNCVTQSEHDKVQSYYVKYQGAAKLAADAIAAYKNSTVPNSAALNATLASTTAAASDSIGLVESLLSVSETTTLKQKLPKGVK